MRFNCDGINKFEVHTCLPRTISGLLRNKNVAVNYRRALQYLTSVQQPVSTAEMISVRAYEYLCGVFRLTFGYLGVLHL